MQRKQAMLTKREMDEYNTIQFLWATRKATSKQILRALALRRKAERKVAP